MLNGYPRPMLERKEWVNLNGTWNFAFDDAGKGEASGWYGHFPEGGQTIIVPYTYETKMSGIGDETFHPEVWYSKKVELHDTATVLNSGKRVLLHFEGVDHDARVWVNGYFAGSHSGAYARFTCDITDYIKEGANDITVSAKDSFSCVHPRGKQRWKDDNFGCWYVQTTGIWKTVWMETVAGTYIESVKTTPDIDRGTVRFEMKFHGSVGKAARLACDISFGDRNVSSTEITVNTEYADFEVNVADPDEPWQVQPWTPENPNLYNVSFRLASGSDTDEAASYFGMRKICTEGGRVLLNNRPVYQRLILDQGYWNESHLTPPSEEAIIKDIELISAAGYNGLRKHQKVEDERFLYWCDVKGLLVWCEMPSPYTFNDDSVESFTSEWMEVVKQNYSHPSVITWTPFNESWGIERVFSDVRQQKFTEGIYNLTKAFDPMRPVIVNDGWEHTVSDIASIHDYEELGEKFAKAYADKDVTVSSDAPLTRERRTFAKGYEYSGQPVMITEYGGIAFCAGSGWGYGHQVASEEEFLNRFRSITKAIKGLGYCSGFCYTQLTDVQQEINGLYTSDRQPKVNIEAVRKINME